jgi:hypothetical protein
VQKAKYIFCNFNYMTFWQREGYGNSKPRAWEEGRREKQVEHGRFLEQ